MIFKKTTFGLQGDDADQTKMWFQTLQFYTQSLGGWRKRRKGLANIMVDPKVEYSLATFSFLHPSFVELHLDSFIIIIIFSRLCLPRPNRDRGRRANEECERNIVEKKGMKQSEICRSVEQKITNFEREQEKEE